MTVRCIIVCDECQRTGNAGTQEQEGWLQLHVFEFRNGGLETKHMKNVDICFSCRERYPSLAVAFNNQLGPIASERPTRPDIGTSDLHAHGDTLCSVCGELQLETASGVTCVNGHGGAHGVPRT